MTTTVLKLALGWDSMFLHSLVLYSLAFASI
ncbi:hypothetical protein YPC_1505 [Yersinia pestis biovar Medievalis str. Harbin 35]|nr:hypothetical protein YPC_1505 [Yersinia pestis biovar Medievalis str. Harbin 35]